MSSRPAHFVRPRTTLSRCLDEIQDHPVITGAAVVGVALTLTAVLHYGPENIRRARRSRGQRIRRGLRAWLR